MKIQICGYSGSGKSTLAKRISEILNINMLHLDNLHFNPNWEVRDNALMDADIKSFLENNDSWVIDGNYLKHDLGRFEDADIIVKMVCGRFKRLLRIKRRIKENRGIQRSDIATGCFDKNELSFDLWVLFGCSTRKRRKAQNEIYSKYKDKVVVLKNEKEIEDFLRGLKDGR